MKKNIAGNLKYLKSLVSFYACFVCLWGLAVTVYDQRATENVTVYITIALAVSLFIIMKPWEAAVLFGGCEFLLVLFLPVFQEPGTNNSGNYMNTLFMTVIAVMMSSLHYRGRAASYCSSVVIAAKNEEILRINEQLEKQVVTDQLTDLCNRYFLEKNLPALWEKAVSADETVGVLMADIDNFKEFNDRYGHGAGDECLKNLADVMRRSIVGKRDILVRYGGEEFLALLIGSGMERTAEAAETFRAGVQQMQVGGDPQRCITVSIGMVSAPASAGAWELINAADNALYCSKEKGKNRVTVVSREF